MVVITALAAVAGNSAGYRSADDGPWLLTRRVALRHVDTIVVPSGGMRERVGVFVILGRWSNVLDDTLSIRWSAPLG
jgi:hypothetical protein